MDQDFDKRFSRGRIVEGVNNRVTYNKLDDNFFKYMYTVELNCLSLYAMVLDEHTAPLLRRQSVIPALEHNWRGLDWRPSLQSQPQE